MFHTRSRTNDPASKAKENFCASNLVIVGRGSYQRIGSAGRNFDNDHPIEFSMVIMLVIVMMRMIIMKHLYCNMQCKKLELAALHDSDMGFF